MPTLLIRLLCKSKPCKMSCYNLLTKSLNFLTFLLPIPVYPLGLDIYMILCKILCVVRTALQSRKTPPKPQSFNNAIFLAERIQPVRIHLEQLCHLHCPARFTICEGFGPRGDEGQGVLAARSENLLPV